MPGRTTGLCFPVSNQAERVIAKHAPGYRCVLPDTSNNGWQGRVPFPCLSRGVRAIYGILRFFRQEMIEEAEVIGYHGNAIHTFLITV